MKSRTLADEEDEVKDENKGKDEFVIYQPSSWAAKRKKASPATAAYTFDWRNDVFGDSPVAVRGQRTKHPKHPIVAPPAPAPAAPARLPPVKLSIPLELSLRLGGRKEAWGSLASVSEVSFASFGSGGSSSNLHELVTPLTDEFGPIRPGPAARDDDKTSAHHGHEDGTNLSVVDLSSPTRRLRDGLDRLHVQSPLKIMIPHDQDDEEGDQKQGIDSPHTPSTPRSVPSDEDSD